jgi:hypothetical protein
MQVFRHSTTIKDAKLWFGKYGERAIRNELRVYLSRELNNKDNKVFKDLKLSLSSGLALPHLPCCVCNPSS